MELEVQGLKRKMLPQGSHHKHLWRTAADLRAPLTCHLEHLWVPQQHRTPRLTLLLGTMPRYMLQQHLDTDKSLCARRCRLTSILALSQSVMQGR